MEPHEVDELVERIERLNSDINQANFKIEGMQDEITKWEDTMPKVFRRRIDLNNRRVKKLAAEIESKTKTKAELDAVLASYQLEMQEKQKAEEAAKAAEDEKKAKIKKSKEKKLEANQV